ncbi:hypothetical protein PAHAL_8G111300 [Panicum hallii]|uniref:Uncharacterized protein n=1 Tax=Panicum hallii TaxID=206008 RepID=A0A2T8I8H4_9POAL|nr:hypothetical protein PAHAL_8G111300 [Panicum hallii]
MKKTQYELERDERVREVQEFFASLGIPILAQDVRDVFSKNEKCMGKTIESDNEYDPSSDIDNQCDSDDDYDDDLKHEDSTEVRAMVPGTRTKKQKMAHMPAANQLPPCSPTKFTRKQAAKPTRGRPPPRDANQLPPCTPTRLTRQQAAMALPAGRPPPRDANQLPPCTPTRLTRQQAAMASPGGRPPPKDANQLPPCTPTRLTRQQAAMASPGGRPPPKDANQLPPCTPTRLTRQQATMASPGGRPPPREILRLPAKTASKANPKTNPISSASRLPNTSPPISTHSGNTEHNTPTPTPILTVFPQVTPTTSVNQSVPVETSPGVQSSRQSNDINDTNDQVDADSEGHTIEGEPVGDFVPAPRKEVRKKTIGLGLEKMIKRGNKLPIQVAEGKKRPDVPLQAAKLASETGVALRDKLPIYTSWKLYEKDGGPVEVQKVLDKVANRLDVDVKNDGPSKSACTDIIKKGVKQQRYHLKRKYFDESLTME